MDPLFFSLQQEPPPPPPPLQSPTTTNANEPPPDNQTNTTETSHHPPYAEMIYAAITALKEQEGSSKRAISKYIETQYANLLPPSHSARLTYHLKRLKDSGLLVMVKKSYMLPGSDSAANLNNIGNFVSGFTGGDAVLTNGANGSGAVQSENLGAPGGVKRGRGRPPKPKPGVQVDENRLPISGGSGMGQSVQESGLGGNASVGGAAAVQPVLASLGLVDHETPPGRKKRPRHPKKVVVFAVQGGAPVTVKRGRGRPPQSGIKKAPGRPPRSGMKKTPGRPKKLKTVSGIKRGPGRPPKVQINSVAPGFAAPVTGGVSNSPRPRGRPKKNATSVVVGTAANASVVMPAKQSGRPQKVGGGILKPRKNSGRPVGRPKKVSSSATDTPQQAEDSEDLKKKLEFFKSKVVHAVSILKPQLNSQAPVTVIAAVQELEGLAAMDLNAPLVEEPQPQQQQQLAPPATPLQQPAPAPAPAPQAPALLQQLPPSQHMPQVSLAQQYFPQAQLMMPQMQLPQPMLMPQQQQFPF